MKHLKMFFLLISISQLLSSCGVDIHAVPSNKDNRTYYSPLLVFESNNSGHTNKALTKKLFKQVEEYNSNLTLYTPPSSSGLAYLKKSDEEKVNDKIDLIEEQIRLKGHDLLLVLDVYKSKTYDGSYHFTDYELYAIDPLTGEQVYKAKFNGFSMVGSRSMGKKLGLTIFHELRERKLLP